MCGAKVGGPDLAGIDVTTATVIQGQVRQGDEPIGGAYVRLLDASGEFTAEVVTSATGQYRFFARPGDWTLRALSNRGSGDARAQAAAGSATEVDIQVTS